MIPAFSPAIASIVEPNCFVWSRLMDAAHSIADRHALETLARVERWALDEVPLPGKLDEPPVAILSMTA